MILLPRCDVALPANTISFFEKIFEIVAFEINEAFGSSMDSIFGLKETQPFKENFAELGFESRYFLSNMGTMTLIYISFPLLILF